MEAGEGAAGPDDVEVAARPAVAPWRAAERAAGERDGAAPLRGPQRRERDVEPRLAPRQSAGVRPLQAQGGVANADQVEGDENPWPAVIVRRPVVRADP